LVQYYNPENQIDYKKDEEGEKLGCSIVWLIKKLGFLARNESSKSRGTLIVRF
jgi:hypothetical protein